MRDYDDLPYIVIERRSAGFGPFLWGALLGAGAALLLAPRSGQETQEELRDGYLRARRAAEDRVEAVRTRVDQTRTRLNDEIGAVRSRVDARTEQARETLDSARRAARDARAELERKVSDVREGFGSARETMGDRPTNDRAAAAPDVVVTDVGEERTEGRSDLG